MKLTKLLPLAFLAISHIAPADAQERREIPDYRETGFEQHAALSAELDDFLAAYTAAWGAQDTDSFIALHHEDTEWINAYARMFQSDESLAVFLEERLFPAFAAQVSRTEVANMRRVSTRLIGDDVARPPAGRISTWCSAARTACGRSSTRPSWMRATDAKSVSR